MVVVVIALALAVLAAIVTRSVSLARSEALERAYLLSVDDIFLDSSTALNESIDVLEDYDAARISRPQALAGLEDAIADMNTQTARLDGIDMPCSDYDWMHWNSRQYHEYVLRALVRLHAHVSTGIAEFRQGALSDLVDAREYLREATGEWERLSVTVPNC